MPLEPKVLHIIDSLGLGGAQTGVQGVFESQLDNDRIFLFALRQREVMVHCNHEGVQVFPSNAKYSLAPLFVLRKLILKERIEVLHCHLFRSQVFGWILKKLWFKDIKLVVHEHGEVFQGHPIYNWFLRMSRRLVDAFLAVSEATKQALIKIGKIDPARITVLPNFVELEKFQASGDAFAQDKFTEQEKPIRIGFAGRLDYVKGCSYLLRALPQLTFPYQVVIAGVGPEKDGYDTLLNELGLQDKVTFLGFCQDMPKFYRSIDVLVIPSVFESFGFSAVEAQAAGVPVIASRVGGLPEIIQDEENGLLCAPQNVDDLAEKLILLATDGELRARLSERAQSSVQSYALSSYITRLNAFYAAL